MYIGGWSQKAIYLMPPNQGPNQKQIFRANQLRKLSQITPSFVHYVVYHRILIVAVVTVSKMTEMGVLGYVRSQNGPVVVR